MGTEMTESLTARHRSAAARVAKCVAAFGSAFLVLGAVAAAVDVYGFGNYDPKFGPDGTFRLAVLVTIYYMAAASVVCGVVAICVRHPIAQANRFWAVLSVFALSGGLLVGVLWLIFRLAELATAA